jgi:hypothetical protein
MTSGNDGEGLGDDDLNLLSRMESNSANCSMVLEDIDLTIAVPAGGFAAAVAVETSIGPVAAGEEAVMPNA